MTWGGWFCSTTGPPRTLLPHCVACSHPALLLATGLQKRGLGLQLKEMDARTLLIGHSIKGHGGPPLLWGPVLWVSPSPSSHTHTHTQARKHTHTALSPASATWGISKACKQANHPLPFSLFFSRTQQLLSGWQMSEWLVWDFKENYLLIELVN